MYCSAAQRSRQAVTRENAEQASKRYKVGADPPMIRGRPPSLANRGSGPMADEIQVETECRHTGDPCNTEKPTRQRRVTSNRTPARDKPGCLGWRTGPQDRRNRLTPVEGRGLSSRPTSERAREPGDWCEPRTSGNGSETPGDESMSKVSNPTLEVHPYDRSRQFSLAFRSVNLKVADLTYIGTFPTFTTVHKISTPRDSGVVRNNLAN